VSVLLTVASLHPAIPALCAGMTICLTRRPDGELEVTVPGTPGVLERIAAAARDGAFGDPGLRDIEAEIMADRDRLYAMIERLEALAAEPRHRDQQAG
jgi:hypothetical protein